jgi:hypothetical protein
MPEKIVEVTHDGKIVARYPIVFNSLNAPVSEQEFISLAKHNLKADGYSEKVISAATFRVLNNS